MMDICMVDVPSYLQQSALYMSLEAGDGNSFQIPNNVLKQNLDIHSFQDLTLLLHTVRFWGTLGIPYEVTQFILSTWSFSEEEEKELKKEFTEYWGTLGDLIAVKKTSPDDKVVVAITLQLSLDIVVYLLQREQLSLNASMCQCAARYNRLDCLQYLHRHGCPWDAGTTSAALTYGNIECFKFAASHGCEVCAMVIVRPDAFP